MPLVQNLCLHSKWLADIVYLNLINQQFKQPDIDLILFQILKISGFKKKISACINLKLFNIIMLSFLLSCIYIEVIFIGMFLKSFIEKNRLNDVWEFRTFQI
jgi:hypothetical protein